MTRLNAMINQSPTIVEVLGADMESPPHKAVMYDASGNVVLATNPAAAIGLILSNHPESMKAGQEVNILIKDIGLGEAGAAIKKGDRITINANGQVIPATGNAGVFGRAFTAASAAGELVHVQINGMG